MQIIAKPYTDAADVASNTAARHTQGTDQGLDTGGDNAVTAANAKDAVDKKHSQGTDTTLGTMAGNIAMGGYGITGAGTIAGGIQVVANSGNIALTVEQCRCCIVFQADAGTITIPAVSTLVEGANVTVVCEAAAAVHIDVDDSDRIVLDGTALADGNKISSASEAGNQITVVKDSASGLTTCGRSGAWTDGG